MSALGWAARRRLWSTGSPHRARFYANRWWGHPLFASIRAYCLPKLSYPNPALPSWPRSRS